LQSWERQPTLLCYLFRTISRSELLLNPNGILGGARSMTRKPFALRRCVPRSQALAHPLPFEFLVKIMCLFERLSPTRGAMKYVLKQLPMTGIKSQRKPE
jgi:hypothetical protein